ncbi:MlaA family lipoprotein [Motilimonas pumila]|uniref:VacJ family lipoprotein n=1 Tax=Motilimonas pumila TaxID=2303987 RepID=A0A418YGT9_9GAMM|nr:VacJ family lipoprotein [Motilimonas pumila]RJG49056.1 VacJ family lipoprotein [Motilimonas pumila]
MQHVAAYRLSPYFRMIILYLLVMPLFTIQYAMASTATDEPEMHTGVYDPAEGLNRQFWQFNLQVDKHIAKPATEVYVEYIPLAGREALNNFVQNFDEPSSAVNHLLMLDITASMDSLMRFMFNTTFGVAGFFDFAGNAGLTRNRAEFQDVLANVGVGHGPYLMIPIYGPETTRRLVGNVVDALYFPYSELTYFERFLHWGVDSVYKRAALLPQDALIEQSLDPYIFVRDAYIQYQDFRINGEVFIHQQQDGLSDDELDALLDEYE